MFVGENYGREIYGGFVVYFRFFNLVCVVVIGWVGLFGGGFYDRMCRCLRL